MTQWDVESPVMQDLSPHSPAHHNSSRSKQTHPELPYREQGQMWLFRDIPPRRAPVLCQCHRNQRETGPGALCRGRSGCSAEGKERTGLFVALIVSKERHPISRCPHYCLTPQAVPSPPFCSLPSISGPQGSCGG